VKDLIRRARRAEAINSKLIKYKKSSFTNQSADEILIEFKLNAK
jgi:antitoxin ParD1/3/4